MDFTVNNANKYIKENVNKVNSKYRLEYHMMPPIGWMNDPNGCVKFNYNYHIFYQYYPYDAKWGPMHWGHFISKDLIKYTDVEVALAPDQELESGCWSGGAIAAGEELHLVYTRHYEVDGFKTQQQYIARSSDAINFTKDLKPCFDNNSLPENINRSDFRDPYPLYINGVHYLLVAGKLNTNEGILIVLKGDTPDNLSYHFHIGPFYEMGVMCECPSYFNVDGVDVFLASGCQVKQKDNSYKNANSTYYMAGHIDFENKKFDCIKISEIDKGDSFYASQFVNSNDKPIMISWMEMWEKKYPTVEQGHNWIGAITIPRILNWKNGTLYQSPIEEIKNYYVKSYEYSCGTISKVSDITIKAHDNFRVEFEAINGKFVIGQNENGVYLDTNGSNSLNDCVRHTDKYYKDCEVRVLLDTSSIEIFVNNGIETITNRVYLDSDYKLNLSGLIDSIYVNEIEVK